jgi:hypothetical protein
LPAKCFIWAMHCSSRDGRRRSAQTPPRYSAMACRHSQVFVFKLGRQAFLGFYTPGIRVGPQAHRK